MKMAMTALAVVLLAGATAAQAQPEETRDRVDRVERDDDSGARPSQRPQRDWTSERPGRNVIREAPRDREPATPVAPPVGVETPAAQDRGARWRGDGGRPDRGDQVRGDERREGERGAGGGRDRRDGEGRWDGRRGDDRRWDGRGGEDRRWDDRRRDDGRWHDGRWDNHRRDDRWSDRRYDRYPRWERGRYANIYVSPSRYRYAWRPPYGYYSRSWGFGDLLPRGWYGPSYAILDPWRFNLPLPPPGLDWVRAGDDALLVDQFNGRIVQVVRNLFW